MKLGVLLGIIGGIVYWYYHYAGFDSKNWFLLDYFPNYVLPYNGYLLLFPFRLLSWPMGGILLSSLFILLAYKSKVKFIHIILSGFVWYEIWLGQIEVLIMIGIYILIWSIDNKDYRFLFLSLIFLTVKIQYTFILSIYCLFLIIKNHKRSIIYLCLFFITTVILNPEWLSNWYNSLFLYSDRNIHTGNYFSIFLGILFFIIGKKYTDNKIIFYLLLGFLFCPYLQSYHLSLLSVFMGNPIVTLLSWLVFIDKSIFNQLIVIILLTTEIIYSTNGLLLVDKILGYNYKQSSNSTVRVTH